MQSARERIVNEFVTEKLHSKIFNSPQKQLKSYVPPTGFMPRKGDIFKGEVNDLYLWDADDGNGKWRRRDITFFKHELNRREKFAYPTSDSRITLIDTDKDRYELKFSNPETEDGVCLGTPSRLKPWYRKQGFDNEVINPNERIYFVYTGREREFIVLTTQEYDLGKWE